MQNYIFTLFIPNKLRIITIKFVKCIRDLFAIGLFHLLELLKRYGVLFPFGNLLVVAHTFYVRIVVFAFHQELVQSLSDHKGVGVATIEPSILSSLKACDKQQELDHFQCLVVRIDVAGEVVDLLLAESVIRHTEKDEHSLKDIVYPVCGRAFAVCDVYANERGAVPSETGHRVLHERILVGIRELVAQLRETTIPRRHLRHKRWLAADDQSVLRVAD